jgi:hypothetical protein
MRVREHRWRGARDPGSRDLGPCRSTAADPGARPLPCLASGTPTGGGAVQARDVLTRDVVTVRPHPAARHAVEVVAARGLAALPVAGPQGGAW